MAVPALLAVLVTVSGSLGVVRSEIPAGKPDGGKVWEQLKAHIEQSGEYPGEAKAAAIGLLDAGGDGAISRALAEVHPEYARAVAAADGGDLKTAVELLEPFAAGQEKKWLAADATWYLARTLMNSERFEDAVPRLEQLTGNMSENSAHLAEANYYIAACHAGMLQTDLAVHAFSAFLEQFPEASERLRVSAWRQLQELQESADPAMTAVTTRMEYSRRRLDISESGGQTQTEQDRIVKLLAEMIQEQQKKECSSGSCSKSGTKPQPQQQAQKQGAPQKPSQSNKGGMSNVANGEAVEKSFDNGDASPWSRLRDRSRDAANSAIKEKLPVRYREIVERYNDAVSGNSSAGSQAGGNEGGK